MFEQPDTFAVPNDALSLAARRRRRWIRGVLIATGVCVALCSGAGVLLSRLYRSHTLKVTLQLGRLADLPVGANDVRIDGSSNLFTSCYRIRFKATPDEIEAFVACSPGLRGIAVEQFTPEHMYLPSPDFRNGTDADGHCYYRTARDYPWFDPTIRVKGRRFEIPQDHNANYGEVLLNAETQTVFIWVAHS